MEALSPGQARQGAGCGAEANGPSLPPLFFYYCGFFSMPLPQAASNSFLSMVPSIISIDLLKVHDLGSGVCLTNVSPLGTALLQIALHWSGVRTAEGRPADIVFCCAVA